MDLGWLANEETRHVRRWAVKTVPGPRPGSQGGKQLIKAVGVLAYVSSAWIYYENNTRDRQQRDIRCRTICQHHWGPFTGHSVAPLHVLRVAA